MKEGASVLIADIDQEGAGRLKDSLVDHRGTIEVVRCDVSRLADLEAAFAKGVDAFGGLDTVVNNAAIGIGGVPITEYTEESWKVILDTNLSSVFRMCRLMIGHLTSTKTTGSIVNIASSQAHVGFSGWSAYAAIKGAIVSLTRQLACEYGPAGIRLNSVSPGAIETDMCLRYFEEQGEGSRESLERIHPLGRLGDVSEVAAVVVFLASNESGFVTGADYRVDGGQTATSHDYLS